MNYLVMKKFKGFAISFFLVSSLVINAQECPAPPAPLIGTITQPTCEVSTGSVILNGLPATGTWILIRYPGDVPTTGTGTTATVTGLAAGTYSFTVTSAEGCISVRSADAVINKQADVPDPPNIGNITQPTCITATGSVVLNRLPGNGTWTVTIIPGGATRTGSGSNTTISGLATGSYNFTVTSSSGCTSPQSANAVINSQPLVPLPPVIGTVTQPGCEVSTGSVMLSGLPSESWTLTLYPGGVNRAGSGTTYNFTGLVAGTYSFTVTSAGCTSESSANAVINQPANVPAAPSIGTITQPGCDIPTGSVVINGLPAGTWTLTRNPGNFMREGSGSSTTDSGLEPGTYNYTVTSGCTSPSSENVQILASAAPPPSPVVRIDCLLGTGFAIVTVIQPTTHGLEFSIDGGPFRDTRTFFGVSNGLHTITVRNSAGCSTTGDPFSVSCGCVNRPSVTLDSRNGTACGTSPITVNGNTFGGSATAVAITEDGAGSVSPSNVTSSPFSFTYTPAPADAGRTVTITFTTNNPVGSPCSEAMATYILTVNPVPASPVPGNVTHPTCTSSTGSVVLNGLPGSGNWMLVRNPGNVTTTGSGLSATISGLESGTYTFRVSVSGCLSAPSAPVQINAQPPVASPPRAGNIVQPSCIVPTGSITLNGLPAGPWTLIRFPGTISVSGSGTSTIITALAPGTYNFTVTGVGGCSSLASANIVINAQPPIPQIPATGTITTPTCSNPEGRVVLSGLPSSGIWTVNSVPAGISQSGNGTSAVIRGLSAGNSYVFTVTNSNGCVSGPTANVAIPQIPNAPFIIITNPAPVCFPSTVDLTTASITAGSTAGLTFTYWTNPAATVPYGTPARATTGTYYIKGTNQAECSDIEVVIITVRQSPVADAGPDQVLNYAFSSVITANQPVTGETGTWSIFRGKGLFTDASSSRTTVTELGIGENIFLWTVTDGVCPPAADTLKMTVRDLIVPTLITPNEDGRNDYFRMEGIEMLKGNELVIFDRRGIVVYRNNDYKNEWNGIDYNDKPLPSDTYFYIFKSGNGRSRSGYIVIRR